MEGKIGKDGLYDTFNNLYYNAFTIQVYEICYSKFCKYPFLFAVIGNLDPSLDSDLRKTCSDPLLYYLERPKLWNEERHTEVSYRLASLINTEAGGPTSNCAMKTELFKTEKL